MIHILSIDGGGVKGVIPTKILQNIENDPKKKHLLQRKTMCQTIAGNNCDYLIISDFNNGK